MFLAEYISIPLISSVRPSPTCSPVHHNLRDTLARLCWVFLGFFFLCVCSEHLQPNCPALNVLHFKLVLLQQHFSQSSSPCCLCLSAALVILDTKCPFCAMKTGLYVLSSLCIKSYISLPLSLSRLLCCSPPEDKRCL